VVFLVSCGPFLINGNYKTYVKSTITDDEFLTLIGIMGGIGNGCSRILWNMFFQKTGYKTVMLTLLGIEIIVFSTIHFTK
jgi:Na+/melibiose symporter-like transporter